MFPLFSQKTSGRTLEPTQKTEGYQQNKYFKVREYFFLLGRVFEKMWISKVRGENINLSKYPDEFCIVEPKLNLKQTQVTTQVNSE